MTGTVLVVDDIESNIKLLEAKLLSEYYKVLTAKSAEAALVILQTNKVDIILLDVMMPGMDGITACQKIKSNPETSYIPVVMVTALEDLEDRIRGLEAGADEFLTKPINDLALFARVRSLTRMKSVLDELKLRNQTNESLGVDRIDIIDNFTNAKIVILDDDIVQSKNISKLLSKIVSEVKICKSPESLYSLLDTSYLPDIVIISCQIDEVDSLRICSNLRTKDNLKHISIIFIAEDNNYNIVIRGMELGINDYFITPIDKNELIARVKTQLKRKIYIDNLKHDLEMNFNLSIKDDLTNLFNRRYFDNHIRLMINNAQKSMKSLSLIMVDIDFFKLVNDEYGHQAGDEVIKSITTILRKNVRITDLVARYGGEEFVILIPDLGQEQVLAIAERIRSIVENTEFDIKTEKKKINKTISMGIAAYRAGLSVDDLIRNADLALYKAKSLGRNKIIISES